MPRTRLAKNKDGASEAEVDSEPAPELPSDERGDAELMEAEAVDFINDYENDENEGTFESPPPNNWRGGIGRVEKGGDFNEVSEVF